MGVYETVNEIASPLKTRPIMEFPQKNEHGVVSSETRIISKNERTRPWGLDIGVRVNNFFWGVKARK